MKNVHPNFPKSTLVSWNIFSYTLIQYKTEKSMKYFLGFLETEQLSSRWTNNQLSKKLAIVFLWNNSLLLSSVGQF